MYARSAVLVTLVSGLTAAAPAHQARQASGFVAANQDGNVPGYPDASAPYETETPTPITNVATSFGPDSQVSAIYTTPPAPGQPGAADTQRSPFAGGPTTHGPFSGQPTTTGAVSNSPTAATIPVLPPNPTATYYNTDGTLQQKQPAPYVPYGGLGTNGTEPRYMVNSDFDYESIQLGLYQEWIELDLFNNGVATFSEEDFAAAGLSAEDISLIQFMAQQEQG